MPASRIGHLQVNVASANIPFYKDLLGFLGWHILYDDVDILGMEDEQGASLWFNGGAKPAANDYDGPGMNHLALAAAAQSDVDGTVAYLKERGIPALFDTPRHRPEFSPSPDKTYYQVMFESPDRVLLEVVYMGPLS